MLVNEISEWILILGVFILAFMSYWKSALTSSGAIASVLVGAIIAYGFSLYGLILLASFFLSSSILGKVLNKKGNEQESFEEKGEKRDALQVLANGGWAALASLLFVLSENQWWFFAFIATLAAANSDTWASTIGKRSRAIPKLVLSSQHAFRGQSGGITLLGNVGAILGSLFIVGIAYSLQVIHDDVLFQWWLGLVLLLVGFFAQWLDALAGAYLQGLFKCQVCHQKTEKKLHCEVNTICIKGKSSINNDMINHICTGSAFIFGGVVGYLINL